MWRICVKGNTKHKRGQAIFNTGCVLILQRRNRYFCLQLKLEYNRIYKSSSEIEKHIEKHIEAYRRK